MKNSKQIRAGLRDSAADIVIALRKGDVNISEQVHLYYQLAVVRERHRLLTRMRMNRRANSKAWRAANAQRYREYQRAYYKQTRQPINQQTAP